jgi:hypothetical protein
MPGLYFQVQVSFDLIIFTHGRRRSPPPAHWLLWFENQLEMNVSVASCLRLTDFAQRPLKRVLGSSPAGFGI